MLGRFCHVDAARRRAATLQSLSRAATAHPAPLSTDLKGQTVSDALALNLNKLRRFPTDPGPAIAVPSADILHRYRRGVVFQDQSFARQVGMTQLNQSALVTDAQALDRLFASHADFPAAAFKVGQHLKAAGGRLLSPRVHSRESPQQGHYP